MTAADNPLLWVTGLDETTNKQRWKNPKTLQNLMPAHFAVLCQVHTVEINLHWENHSMNYQLPWLLLQQSNTGNTLWCHASLSSGALSSSMADHASPHLTIPNRKYKFMSGYFVHARQLGWEEGWSWIHNTGMAG